MIYNTNADDHQCQAQPELLSLLSKLCLSWSLLPYGRIFVYTFCLINIIYGYHYPMTLIK